MRNIVFGALALLVAVPAAAQAPANELARCEELYAKYERYSNTGGESRSGSAISSLEARSALQDCRSGNTKQGLAVLERKLRALGFRI
jgi:hypothetical protein